MHEGQWVQNREKLKNPREYAIHVPGFAHKRFCCAQEEGIGTKEKVGFDRDTSRLILSHQSKNRLSYQSLEDKANLIQTGLRSLLHTVRGTPVRLEAHSLAALVTMRALNLLTPSEREEIGKIVLISPVPFGQKLRYAASPQFHARVGLGSILESARALTTPETGAGVPQSTVRNLYGSGCKDAARVADSVGAFLQLEAGCWEDELERFLVENSHLADRVFIVGFRDDACHPVEWIEDVAFSHGLGARLQIVAGGHCGWDEQALRALRCDDF